MNTLAPEEIQKLRDAFNRGLGVRAAARETGMNRETCGKYFAEWDNSRLPENSTSLSSFELNAKIREYDLTIPLILDDALVEQLKRARKAVIMLRACRDMEKFLESQTPERDAEMRPYAEQGLGFRLRPRRGMTSPKIADSERSSPCR